LGCRVDCCGALPEVSTHTHTPLPLALSLSRSLSFPPARVRPLHLPKKTGKRMKVHGDGQPSSSDESSDAHIDDVKPFSAVVGEADEESADEGMV